jgi:hypothetical protein
LASKLPAKNPLTLSNKPTTMRTIPHQMKPMGVAAPGEAMSLWGRARAHSKISWRYR